MADRRKPLAKTVPKRHFLCIVRGTPPLDLYMRHFTDVCFMAGGKQLVVSGQAITMTKACPVKKQSGTPPAPFRMPLSIPLSVVS